MKELYVAIDLGGTRCRVLIANSLSNTTRMGRNEIILTHVYEQDMQSLIDMIRVATANQTVLAIGFSVPGDLNAEKTTFADPSDNLLEWSDKPIKAVLEREFHCPVFLENDGVTAGLGEAYFGAGKGKNFTFVIWGTGVGGSIVRYIDGESICTILDWYQYFDKWEQLCGGNKLQQRYGKEASRLGPVDWQNVMADFRQELSGFIEATGTKFIVFGGGIAIKQQTRLQALYDNFASTELTISQLSEDAGLYGALAVIRQSLHQ